MVRLTVTVNNQEAAVALRGLPGAMERVVRRWLPRAGQITRRVMIDVTQPLLKRPKGHMLASIRTEVRGHEVVTGPHVPYAASVDTGSRPHEIRPRFRKALTIPMAGGVIGTRGKTKTGLPRRVTKFTFGGKTVTAGVRFAKVVRHPGTRGVFFTDRTAEEATEPVREELERLIQEEVGV